MKEKLSKELGEVWNFLKSVLIISGILFWVLIVLWKMNGEI